MSEVWTRERVLALAPDSSAATAGQGLGQLRKWSNLGRRDQALWGEIQGSGSKPYQTRIDLAEPAFKCSCPSRKFPCKHGLGLLLVYADDAGAFPEAEPPGWVSEWLAGRQDRAAKKAERAEQAEAGTSVPRDEAAAAKRVAARETKIAAGLEELSRWMEDLLRQGLATAQAQESSYWEQMAARLVDAQATGLARRVRELGAAAFSGEGWQERLLAGLGRLSLLVTAYRRLALLPPEQAADVRTEVGWSQAQDELLGHSGVRDTWCVLARRVTQEDQLRVQRTWLWGEATQRPALLLHFAAGAAPLDTSLPAGVRVDAELVFFPSAAPLRALVRIEYPGHKPLAGMPARSSIDDALAGYAAVLARQPWVERWPIVLGDVFLEPPRTIHEGTWVVRDQGGRRLPLRIEEDPAWQLFAVAGGRGVGLFGEWNGRFLRAISAAADGRYFTIEVQEERSLLVRVA